MQKRFVPLVTLTVALSACGDDNPVRPTSYESQRLISGTVTEPVGAPVTGFAVRVVDSGRSQLLQADGSGYRALVQEGPVTIEVTKDGYHPKTVAADTGNGLRHDIEIEPVTPPAAFSGTYWMMLSADPAACGLLPLELRTRRYAVFVSQAGAAVTIHVSDPKLTGQRTDGRIHVNALSFDLLAPDWYYGMGAPSIEEKLDETHRLFIVGTVSGTVNETGATGQLAGWWDLHEGLVRTSGCTGVHGVRIERR